MDQPTAPGFAAHWETPEEFILGITEEVWEQRKVDALLDYCSEDLVVRAPDVVLQGNGMKVAATLATLAEFPDAELLGEDVIWSNTRAQQADGVRGALTAHRVLCRARHLGSGVYGPATGAPVSYRILTDSWCVDGQIRDEWQIRDQSAILRQLGQEPRAWVQAQLDGAEGTVPMPAPLTPDSDPDGPYRGTGARGDSADRLAGLLNDVMSGDLATIARDWDRACALAYPGGVTGHGHRDADAFWLGLRSAFPSAAFRIDHRMGREEPARPPRAAVRWSLYGRHDGWGTFGAPSGAYVYVMGMTHAEFGPRGLLREWTLIDETAIWRQIELARG
ncbi:MAG: ester cyclase [Pseudomonadota bacterium]